MSGMLGVATALLLSAQPDYPAYINYSTEQGLSHDEVLSLALDRDGFLWVGTVDGLNRFDGRTFRVYRHHVEDSLSFPGEKVLGITPTPEGRLWLSTDRGLFWFAPDEGRFHAVALPYRPKARHASRLVLDSSGNGWLDTVDSLVHLDLKTLSYRAYPHPPDVADGPGEVTIDSRGRIWLHHGQNLYGFDPVRQRYQCYGGRSSELPGRMYPMGTVVEDPEGEIWVSSWGNGLYRYDARGDSLVDYPDGDLIATCFLFDRDENGLPFIWVGGAHSGLYLWSLRDKQAHLAFNNPSEPYSHNGGMTTTILRDPKSDIVWLGTERGLQKYDPKNIRFHRVLLPAKRRANFLHVAAIIPDRRAADTYYVAGWGDGVYEWHREHKQFRRLSWVPPGQVNGEPFSLYQSDDGTLWIGALHGLYSYHPATGRRHHYADFLRRRNVNHKILHLAGGDGGSLLLGCNYEGLVRFEPASGRAQAIPLLEADGSRQPHHMVSAIERAADGSYWIGTLQGAYRWEPGCPEAHSIAHADFPARLRTDDLLAAHDGTIWVASVEGLFQLGARGEVLAHYGPADGLESGQLLRLAEDRNHHIWIGTGNGLYWFNPTMQIFFRFDKSDGLFSNSIGGAFITTDEGLLLVGYSEGFNFINTSRPVVNRRPPPVVLSGIQVLNRERYLPAGATLRLGPHENVVSFNFSALNYTQSDKNVFAYRLEGFDQDWIVTREGRAVYTNLDGGRYTLRVKAANNDGHWNDQGISLPIEVVPPFTKTGYFYALLTLVLLGGVVGYMQIRRRQHERELAIRDRIARDLHDDVGSTLSSIRFYSEAASRQVLNPQLKPLLDQISQTAGSLSESMQDIIWAVNSRRDQVEDLLARMREYGHRTAAAQHAQLRVTADERFARLHLGLEQRRNIYLIFKEALNNACKYASASEITVDVRVAHRHLIISIADNGRGFDQVSARGGGNGLYNMKKRAGEIGGVLSIRSAPAEGTTIYLRLPLRDPQLLLLPKAKA